MEENSFNKRKKEISEFNSYLEELRFKKRDSSSPKQIPDDLMTKCDKCGKYILHDEFVSNLKVCPFCKNHTRLYAKERMDQILDSGYKVILNDFEEKYLDFPEYKEKLEVARETTHIDEAIVCARGRIDGVKCLVGVMDSHFMMGSMGSVVGEKVASICEEAVEKNLPLILFTCSGGARMQEGIISLFQMAKTSQAISKVKEKGLYISVLTDPTTGGVSASFASLADITLTEPKTLIGFAGKRVIEKTIKEVLPK